MNGLVIGLAVVATVLAIASGVGFILLERRQRQFEIEILNELLETTKLNYDGFKLLSGFVTRHQRSLEAVSRIFGELVADGWPQKFRVRRGKK